MGIYFNKVLRFPFFFELDGVANQVRGLADDLYFDGRQMALTCENPLDQRWNQSLFGFALPNSFSVWRDRDLSWSQIPEPLIGTPLGCLITEVREFLPFLVGSFRLLKLDGGSATSFHQDYDVRGSIPVITNEEALLFQGLGRVYHLPADGSLYLMDARTPHLAINGHPSLARWHIVFSTHTDENFPTYESIFNWCAKSSDEAPAPRRLCKVHPIDLASIERLHQSSSQFFYD